MEYVNREKIPYVWLGLGRRIQVVDLSLKVWIVTFLAHTVSK